MNLRHAVFVLLSVGFAFAGCKDKPTPQGATVRPDVPPPQPCATAVVQPAPSAVVPEPAPAQPQGPRFIVQRRAPKATGYYWLGTGVVVCENSLCMGDAYLITEKGLTDTYDPHDALVLKNPKAFKDSPGISMRYDGAYPEVCATAVFFNDRTDSHGGTLKRNGKTWVSGDCGPGPDYSNEEPAPRPPRDLDDALLHAPIANAATTILRGAGAPPMLIAEQALYVWEGKTWTKRDGPWKKSKQELNPSQFPVSKRPVRLMNGSTLVLDGGYVVDAKGEIAPLQLVQDGKSISPNAERIGALWTSKFPWIIAAEDKDIFLATPDVSDKLSYIRATMPGRTPAAKPATTIATTATAAPNVLPSAAPSAAALPEAIPSASAASSASAPPTTNAPASGISAPKPYTSACTSPFALLASPPKPGQAYATTREALRGHAELQDIVTFVEFVVEGKTYFGVQTRTEADARLFMDIVEKSVKGMKPQLLCLDVLSLIPDRYAPPEGLRIVGINLTTGELVPFD